MFKKLLPISILVIAGCGSISPVVSIGRDTFMVESHGVAGNGTSASEKAKAYQTASNYCTALSKEMQPINTAQVEAGWGRPPSAEVQFRCLSAGDPELARPNLRPGPNLVIEQRTQ